MTNFIRIALMALVVLGGIFANTLAPFSETVHAESYEIIRNPERTKLILRNQIAD